MEETLNNLIKDLNDRINDLTKLIVMSPADAFGNDFWNNMISIGKMAVMPFALCILCYIMTAELYHVYCKSNGDVDIQLMLTTAVKFILPFLIISNCYDLVNFIFLSFNKLIQLISQSLTITLNQTIDVKPMVDYYNSLNFWDKAGYNMQLWPVKLTMNVLGTVIWVIVYGRLFEIILFWVFSPIPLATIIHSEFNQIGKNFIKMFCAIMLQGALMLLCVVIYVQLATNITMDPSMRGCWQMIGYSAVLVFALVKTGSLSKRICGTF